VREPPSPTVSSATVWRSLAIASACATGVLAALVLSPLSCLVAVIGLLVSVLIGVVTLPRSAQVELPSLPADLETALHLARDEDISDRHRRAGKLLLKISLHHDSIYRAVALEQIDDLMRRLTSIAAGSISFEGTETWRIIYEQLLRSPGLYLYRSVAWIKNASYWQDEPSRKSMAVNFELHELEHLNIERIAILSDDLWPANAAPVDPVRGWLHEQHRHGIWLKMVRESALRAEPELLADIGIYGSRALGTQELDDQCRTARFVLTFDFAKVAEAEARWNRLAVYAETFSEHLDRTLPRM
jgi:hypothetical protein